MLADRIDLDEALTATRTGDLWLFRGHTIADRAIQMTTNSPVNHVGMAVVIDDLPALMWHAELGRSLTDQWTGDHHRGAQLHDLREAVVVWGNRYDQQAWLRQLDQPVTRAMEIVSFIRLRQRRNVDLPHPDGPMKAVTERSGMSIVTCFSACFWP